MSDPGTGMFRALAVRNFRLYASASLVSNTGTWMQRIGQDWLVLQLSHDSGVALGVINALQFGPSLVLSMYGGVLGDRYPKRRVLQITQACMGVLALLLGVLVASGAVQLWHVLVLAGALGAVAAIDAPVRQAEVEDGGVVGGERQGLARVRGRADRVDGEPCPGERRGDQFGDARLVLDHQEPHRSTRA